LVDDNEAVNKPALRDLNTVLTVLRRNEKNLDTTLTYAAPYAREFTNVGGSGRWFDATMKFPRNYSVCSTGDSTAATKGLLDPVLSAINQQVNGSTQPCLPLGPAIGGGG
jgi:phospholipid/cholesterol/gamma-HCH transport system substrate-binding protein